MKFLLLFLLSYNLFAFSFFEDKEAIKNEKLIYISSLKNLIVATQKTRGLTNSFKNGNIAAQLLVFSERKEMKVEIKYLLTAPNDEESHIKIDPSYYNRGKIISNDLRALNKSAFKNPSSALVFSLYTDQINKLLQISSQISKEVFKNEDKAEQFNIQVMFDTLLPLSENIGKVRGMGAGIVARGFCKDEEVLKMQGFVQEIRRLSAQMSKEMNALALTSVEESALITKSLSSIESYLSVIEMRVIAKKDIKLNANAYFNQGSATIADVLNVYKLNEAMILN